MYYLLLALFVIALLFSCLFYFRKRKIICKIKCMGKCDKCALIDELTKPFGYYFHCGMGFFSSSLDAWQRNAGYTYLYDYVAPRFQMVFDALPVYFDYHGRTWMIEFWKGQYGINSGAEIGIYHADRIIPEEAYKTTLFECAEEGELLDASFLLYNHEGDYLRTAQKHWWLTAFVPGCFSKPSDLHMEISLTFPNKEMLSAFIQGMYQTGYSSQDFIIRGLTLTFTFRGIKDAKYNLITRIRRRFSQWENKLFCRLYLWITRPFGSPEDRILYLYYYLPVCFRKTLRLHRFHKRCHRQRRCMRRRI